MGMRIFTLAVGQLARNWRVALRIGAVWIAVLVAPDLVARLVTPGDAGGALMVQVILVPAALVAVFAVGLAWHRYILREQVLLPGEMLQAWRDLAFYGWALIRLSLVLLLVLLVLMAILGIVVAMIPGDGVSLFYLMPPLLAIVPAWLALRLGLGLPAAALGQPLTLRESYDRTAPLAMPLLGTALLMLIPALVGAIADFATGPALVVFFPLDVALSAFNLFLFYGLLNVLYGHLVEGRPV